MLYKKQESTNYHEILRAYKKSEFSKSEKKKHAQTTKNRTADQYLF